MSENKDLEKKGGGGWTERWKGIKLEVKKFKYFGYTLKNGDHVAHKSEMIKKVEGVMKKWKKEG